MALNKTQENILDATLSPYLDDILAQELSPALIDLLKICTWETAPHVNISEDIRLFLAVIQHPHPQNRSESYPYVGQETGYVMFKMDKATLEYEIDADDVLLKNGRIIRSAEIITINKKSGYIIAKEPVGLLGLTGREDNKTAAVTKEDVTGYIIGKVEAALHDKIHELKSKFIRGQQLANILPNILNSLSDQARTRLLNLLGEEYLKKAIEDLKDFICLGVLFPKEQFHFLATLLKPELQKFSMRTDLDWDLSSSDLPISKTQIGALKYLTVSSALEDKFNSLTKVSSSVFEQIRIFFEEIRGESTFRLTYFSGQPENIPDDIINILQKRFITVEELNCFLKQKLAQINKNYNSLIRTTPSVYGEIAMRIHHCIDVLENINREIVQIAQDVLCKLPTTDKNIDFSLSTQTTQMLFERNDPESMAAQTKLLFMWIVNNPDKFTVYRDDKEKASKWIHLLRKGLETNSTDWLHQFCRLFFINSLLNGPPIISKPAIVGLKQHSVYEVLTPEILTDSTGKYSKLIFYIAQLEPESTFNIIRNLRASHPDEMGHAKITSMSLLVSLYPVFASSLQTQVLEYILQNHFDILLEDSASIRNHDRPVREFLVGIVRIAMQFEADNRNRILELLDSYKKTLKYGRIFYYLQIIRTILADQHNQFTLTRYGDIDPEFICFASSYYKPICDWLLEQSGFSEIEFKRIMEELALNIDDVSSWKHIEWIIQRFRPHLDSSIIDDSLYKLLCEILARIENKDLKFPYCTRVIFAEVFNNSSTELAQKIIQMTHEKQSAHFSEDIFLLQKHFYSKLKSTMKLADFPSYISAADANKIMYSRFTCGQVVDKKWVEDYIKVLFDDSPDDYESDKCLINELNAYSDKCLTNELNAYFDNAKEVPNYNHCSLFLPIAEWSDVLTPFEKEYVIYILFFIAWCIRTHNLTMSWDYNIVENASERTYLALLNLVPNFSSAQYKHFENIVLESLRLNTAHSREVAEVLFKNRALIREPLATSIINQNLSDSLENIKLCIGLKTEMYFRAEYESRPTNTYFKMN